MTHASVIVLGRKGRGKTRLLAGVALAWRRRFGRPVLYASTREPDQADRIPDMPMLWEHYPEWGDDGADSIAAVATQHLHAGSLLIIDEAGAWMDAQAKPSWNPLVRYLSTARNDGVHYALADKTPTHIPRVLTDSADLLLYSPSTEPRYAAYLVERGGRTTQLARGKFYALPLGVDGADSEIVGNDEPGRVIDIMLESSS